MLTTFAVPALIALAVVEPDSNRSIDRGAPDAQYYNGSGGFTCLWGLTGTELVERETSFRGGVEEVYQCLAECVGGHGYFPATGLIEFPGIFAYPTFFGPIEWCEIKAANACEGLGASLAHSCWGLPHE